MHSKLLSSHSATCPTTNKPLKALVLGPLLYIIYMVDTGVLTSQTVLWLHCDCQCLAFCCPSHWGFPK